MTGARILPNRTRNSGLAPGGGLGLSGGPSLKKRRLRMHRAIAVAVAVLAMAASAWPQASTGTVDGTVRDQSGAVVANTQVVLTNAGTNVNSTTRTNQSGLYLFPGVNPGPYRLMV